MPIYKMPGKKDGLQKYRVRINYKDASGADRQIDRVAYGLEEAKELERKLQAELKESAPAKKMTVQELYDEYVLYQEYRIREASLYKTKNIYETHISDELSNVKLKDLSLDVLQAWKNTIEKKSLSLTMKRNIFATLRGILNYGVKFEKITSHKLDKLGNFVDPYETKKEMEYYTAEEFLKFIAEAKKSAQAADLNGNIFEWNYYVFFSIAFYTGLRKGEIHALKWSDIENDILHVRRSITQKMKGADRETPPKNKSSYRSLQIPAPLKSILDEHYDRYKKADSFNDDWRVCGGLSPLRDTSLENHKKRFAKDAGIKNIRMHDFRHSHASLLANEGINIQEISRRLGHSKIEITWNTYSHLYPREEERAIKILDKIV